MNAVLEDRVDALERQIADLTAEVAQYRREGVAPASGDPSTALGASRAGDSCEAEGPAEPAPGPDAAPAPSKAPESYALYPVGTARLRTGSGSTASPGTTEVPRPEAMASLTSLGRPRSAASPRETFDIEELLGGRLLALVGGIAVVVGIAFFVALAINHGWIDEAARVTMAGVASAVLCAAGVWLYERKGHTQAALATVGSAITGMFLTLTAAATLYHLVSVVLALAVAVGIGALATTIAVRWDSRTVAGLGIGGTLLTPLLGSSLTTPGMAFLAVASGSAAAVLVWRRWRWLAVGASVLTLGQVVLWTALDTPGDAELVAVLSVFAALNLALTLGYELRDSSATLERSTALLVPFGALVLGSLGYSALPHAEGRAGGAVWLIGLALAHAGAAAVAAYHRRVSDEIALVLLGAALVLGDIAFGMLGNGWVLGLGWAGSALGFAVIARRRPRASDLVQVTLGAQLALAIGHVLLFDAQPQLLSTGGGPGAGSLAALVAVVVAAFASARLLVDERYETRIVLDGLTMAGLAYATALTFDGPALLLAWAAAGVALARAADSFEDRVARVGAYCFLALVAGHVLVVEAPPSALLYGLRSPLDAALGIGLVAALAVVCSRLEPGTQGEQLVLVAVASVAALYLASTAIVSGFQPSSTSAGAGLGGGVRQEGQALLSAFWGLCGITSLWVGVRGRTRVLRLAGLGLLTLAAGKVFLYDLSTLQSVYRVASFIALGLLLLTAAFVHQNLRAKA
jgi:uncharacterized membrane protein